MNKSLERRTLWTILLKAAVYILTGALLVLADYYIVGRVTAARQMFAITLITSVLFIGTLIGNTIYLQIMKKGGKGAVGYYLANKLVRLLAAVGVVVGYAVAGGSDLAVFSINLFVLYIVSTGLSLFHYSKMERILKQYQ